MLHLYMCTCLCHILNQSNKCLKFTFKFILTFMSVSLLEVITWVPLCLEVEIWYATYPVLNFKLCARIAPRSCPGVDLEVQRAGAFVYIGHMSVFCCFFVVVVVFLFFVVVFFFKENNDISCELSSKQMIHEISRLAISEKWKKKK